MAETWGGPERTRGLVLLGTVFLLGMVCGASLFYLGQRSMMPPRPPGPWLDRLSRDLDLDPDQRKKIEEVLAEHRAQMRKLAEDGRSGIRDLLRPDQQKIFDAMPHDHPGHHGWPGPPPDGENAPGPPPPVRP
jgi:hypothetical protein